MFAQQLNNLLLDAGTNNKYQFIILFLFIITFIGTELFFISIADLEMQPFVLITYKDTSRQSEYKKLTYELCEQGNQGIFDYTIDTKENPLSSLVIDMKIYCDPMITSLIAVTLFTGLIIGSSSAYFFADHFGRRNTILYAYLIYIGLLLILFFLPSIKWIIFPFLFLIGMFSYIINICIMTYICEIILPNKIEIYMTLLVSGAPLGRILYDYLFYKMNNYGWRYILLGTSGVCLIVYIALITYMCESPLYYLNNGNFRKFKKNLQRIAQKNHLVIPDENFDFLPDPTEKKLVSCGKTDLLIENAENDDDMVVIRKVKPFWKKTMKNYTPFDLIKYGSQISNFFVLCFLWGIGNIILHGLNIYSKQLIVPDKDGYNLVSSFVNEIDLLANIIILLVIFLGKFQPKRFLICLLLLTFTAFLGCLLLNQTFSAYDPFSCMIYFNKMSWSCMYTILYIITAKIYPSMLRTKGLGLNRAIGVLCGIGGPYLIQHSLDNKEFVNYYLIITFFGIVFTYVLPDEYEAIYQIPENEKGVDGNEIRDPKGKISNENNQKEEQERDSNATNPLSFMPLIPDDDNSTDKLFRTSDLIDIEENLAS